MSYWEGTLYFDELRRVSEQRKYVVGCVKDVYRFDDIEPDRFEAVIYDVFAQGGRVPEYCAEFTSRERAMKHVEDGYAFLKTECILGLTEAALAL